MDFHAQEQLCKYGNRMTRTDLDSISLEARREERQRMFQLSDRFQFEPVSGAGIDALDLRRLHDYFSRVLGGAAPARQDLPEWISLLCNVLLMKESMGQEVATISGLLLFGKSPHRFLPQSGIRALCYPGISPDSATRADEDLRGAMIPLGAADGTLVEIGLVERAWDFVRRNTTPTAHLEGWRRIDRWEFPEEVVREAVVNALVHRDYSMAETNITLAIYADRLEILSPGCLPNTVTVEGMQWGIRYARNQTLVNIMRDYGYVDARGMGVHNKIIPGMRMHNKTAPDLIAEESRFIVRLWKEPQKRESEDNLPR